MQPYFDLTDDQIAFFEPLFGPYPLDQYGLAFTESPPGLAMETQGRSLFSRDDFAGGDTGFLEHLLLSHELAHQWFGDAVTPAEWDDLWLNESFATYAQWLWLDHVGLTVLEREADLNLAPAQFATEPTGRAVGGEPVRLRALRRRRRRRPRPAPASSATSAFFTLLQRWVAENDGTSRTTEDFIALAEEVAGRSLDAFFDAWLYSPSVPDEYPG